MKTIYLASKDTKFIYEHLKSKTSITIENPKSSFQTLAVEARSDTLAYVWSKLYLKTVTDFYIDTKTKDEVISSY